MNRIKTILLTLAAIAAGTSATRADDLSDLVAAVAASMDRQRIRQDALQSTLDAGKPHYAPAKKSGNISVFYLDGLLSSMKRESFRKMRRDIYGDDGDDEATNPWGDRYTAPTLGRPDFFRPVKGVITSRFGWRQKFNRMHHGVDLALNIGDTVRAALSGTVELISYDHNGYGHYVIMSHPDGMETLYGHLLYPVVAQGQFITAGEPVGIGGNTGNSTGPHLHFESRLGGTAIDPLMLFDFDGNHSFIYEEHHRTTDAEHTKGPVYSHQKKSLKKESTYIVRVGDTLESIARRAGISAMRLRQLNMLNSSDPPPVGRMLKLK